MNKPKKCLVTGGCGFLGSNIASSYLNLGVEVVIIDALLRNGGQDNLSWLKSQSTKDQLHVYQVDLADTASVEKVFAEHAPFDYVCHLAGQVAMTTSMSDPRRDMLTNVVGTFNILESARKHSPDALVAYSSTNKVYGDLLDLEYGETETRYTLPHFPSGIDESMPLDFASPYGCSKGAADSYVKDWFRNFGLRSVVFRHSSIYGGRQYSTFDQGWIGWFVNQALLQKKAFENKTEVVPFTISGSGKQVRDVLHSSDLIQLYHAAYHFKDAVAGQVFNIGGGMDNSLSLLELFAVLENLLDLKKPLEFHRLPKRQSDQDFFVANIRKINDYTSWCPEMSVKDGLAMMIEWCGKTSH